MTVKPPAPVTAATIEGERYRALWTFADGVSVEWRPCGEWGAVAQFAFADHAAEWLASREPETPWASEFAALRQATLDGFAAWRAWSAARAAEREGGAS